MYGCMGSLGGKLRLFPLNGKKKTKISKIHSFSVRIK
jgi:hypothetical protein